MIPQEQIPALSKFSGSFWRTLLHKDSKPLFSRLREVWAECGNLQVLHRVLASFNGESSVSGPKWFPYLPQHCLMLGSGIGQWVRSHDGTGWIVTRPTEEDALPVDFIHPALGPGYTAIAPAIVNPEVGAIARSWLVPIPLGVQPLVIAGKRWLVAGVDYQLFEGWLQVFAAPDDLFSPDGFVMVRGRDALRNPLIYAFGSDGLRTRQVARYYRENQSPECFIAAACEAGGLVRIEQDCIILAAAPDGYVTDVGALDVPYEHTTLAAGTVLATGTFIGAAPAPVGLDVADFPGGLPLTGITPWNLTIPPGVVRVDVVDGHCQPYLVGDMLELIRFWHYLAQADVMAPDYTVAGVLELADGTHYLDWLTLTVEQVLGRHAWLLRLNAGGTDVLIRKRIREFIDREKPLGKIVLVLDNDA